MQPSKIIQRIARKIQWIKTHHWPIFQSRVQFCGLLFFGSRSISLSSKSTLIVSPHQDDETLGCGGIIALKRAQDIAVNVLFMTDGSASHCWHPNFKNGEISPVRHQEAIEALQILGVEESQIRFLDQPDGQLKWVSESVQESIVTQLTNHILAVQPGEIYVTHRHDRSNDHEMTYSLIKAAIQQSGLTIDLLEYPIWILWKPLLFKDLSPQELSGAKRLFIGTVMPQKRRALEAYRSQYTPIGETTSTVLPKGFLWRFFLPYEVFF